MDANSITNKVIGIITETFLLQKDEVNEKSRMGYVKNWDSLNHLHLIISLEQEFGIDFHEDEIVKMTSTTIIVEIISHKIIK